MHFSLKYWCDGSRQYGQIDRFETNTRGRPRVYIHFFKRWWLWMGFPGLTSARNHWDDPLFASLFGLQEGLQLGIFFVTTGISPCSAVTWEIRYRNSSCLVGDVRNWVCLPSWEITSRFSGFWDLESDLSYRGFHNNGKCHQVHATSLTWVSVWAEYENNIVSIERRTF